VVWADQVADLGRRQKIWLMMAEMRSISYHRLVEKLVNKRSALDPTQCCHAQFDSAAAA
jgi:hypothetical protein